MAASRMNRHQHLPRLEFHRRESVRGNLHRLADAFADAAQALADPSIGTELAVHEMRLAIKRLRALWRLVRPAVGRTVAQQAGRQLQVAARTLAPARDATVGLRTLDTLASHARPTTAAAVAAVRERLAKSLPDRHPSPATLRRALVRVARTTRASATRLRRLPWQTQGWDVVETSLRKDYQRARRRLRTAQATSSENHFHDSRTAIKSLLYQLYLVRPASPKSIGRIVRDLDQLQDYLGLEHDLTVLGARLARTPRKWGSEAELRLVVDLLHNRQQRLRKLAVKLGRRRFAARPRAFVKPLARSWKRWRRRTA